MAANRSPGYKCPYCPARFTKHDGFRQGRSFHVRTKHPDQWPEFVAEKREGRHGFGDWGTR